MNDQAEESARQATRDQEEATAAMEAAIAEQTAQFAEEMARTREAAEAAAFETQMAIAQAAEDQKRAMAKAAEEHKRITANAWKLQAQAKSDQAYRLYQSGLVSEALDLALQAIKEDPAGIDGIFVAGACLEAQGKVEEARAYLARQVQMLTMPDYQMQVKIHTQVLHAIELDQALIRTFCGILRTNVPRWSVCERIEAAEKLIDALLAIKEYQLGVLTQRWVIESRGLTLETLASTRRLFTTIANSPSGIDASRSEIEKILRWLESPANNVTEYATRSKTGQTALFAVASSLELSRYIHFESGLLANYFKELPFDKRTDFQVELSDLKQLASTGQVDQNAYSAICAAAKQKYTSWTPDIEEQVRVNGASQIKNLPKEGSGCLWTIFWMFVLAAIQVALFAMKRSNMSFSRLSGPYPAALAFGLVLGAILLASLSLHVIRAFKRSRKAHELMLNLSNQQNAAFEQLELPQISIQKPAIRPPIIDLMICGAAIVLYLFGWQILISKAAGSSVNPSIPGMRNALYNGSGVEDELKGQTSGNAFGVGWTSAIGGRGASFRASDSSRIEYPSQIPAEGTLEFWIKVDSAYQYANGVFKPNLNCAIVFSTDAQGGDVTWPGDLKFTLCKSGHMELWMATSAYNRPAAVATVAKATSFRFGEWHALGASYGSNGQYIMLDGTVVAAAPSRTQRLGGGGTHDGPADVPTLGETVSHFFQPRQYSGGFEGTVARFRASTRQQDWRVAKAIDEPIAAGGTSATVTEDGTPASAEPDTQSGRREVPSTPAEQSSSATDQTSSFGRTRVSAREMAALKTFGVIPPYPPIARAARVEGTVSLDAIVSEDGSVKSLAVISGPAMLQQSALEAVRTWRYKPYLVNGAPREVETNIEVVFKLAD